VTGRKAIHAPELGMAETVAKFGRLEAEYIVKITDASALACNAFGSRWQPRAETASTMRVGNPQYADSLPGPKRLAA